MKLAVSTLLLAISSSAFAGSLLGHEYLPYRRDVNVMRRQSSAPIVGNLTNAQAEAGYAAQCSEINSAAGSAAIQADIQNVTTNSLAIEVRCSAAFYHISPVLRDEQKSFQTIGAQLAVIDSENLDPTKFSPGWKNLTQVYVH